MIKSLLGEDETTEKEELKVDKKNSRSSAINSILPDDEIESLEEIKAAILAEPERKVDEQVAPFEVERPIGQPKPEGQSDQSERNLENVILEKGRLEEKAERLEKEILAIEKELSEETGSLAKEQVSTTDIKNDSSEKTDLLLTQEDGAAKIHISQKPFTPESSGETARKSGLAFSAAISLFASVVFMLILGWFVDLYVGSSPWGIVGGITLGAIIGFVQFFRTTRQIINPQPSDFEKTSLFSSAPDEKSK